MNRTEIMVRMVPAAVEMCRGMSAWDGDEVVDAIVSLADRLTDAVIAKRAECEQQQDDWRDKIPWGEAPEDAQWWAQDDHDGLGAFFFNKPRKDFAHSHHGHYWIGEIAALSQRNLAPNAKDSLTRRPER